MPRKFVQKAMSYIGDSGGIDTSDATATAADILSGKTAYVPAEAVNTYKTADGFTQYADNIQAIGT